MADENFALATSGASIADVSHEALHVASAASNLLVEREDMLWITGDAPQFVTIRIAANHPPIRFVGWHVWHDYLSNPKVVNVSSGILPDCLTTVVTCTALPGAGTQLWELDSPIPPAHTFVRFTIQSTFAQGPTYMNHLCLYALHPGAKFSNRNAAAASGSSMLQDSQQQQQQLTQQTAASSTNTSVEPRQPGSFAGTAPPPPPMSSLLRDLDDDIRALHPIRAVSPSRNLLMFSAPPAASIPSLVDAEIGEYIAAASRRSPSSQQPQYSTNPNPSAVPQEQPQSRMTSARPRSPTRDALSVIDNTTFRLAALEQAVTSLTRALEHQRQDIVSIKELLASRPAAHAPHSKDSPNSKRRSVPQPVEIKFPEEQLKTFIEETLAPKLAKYAQRTEARTLEKLESQVTNMLDQVSDTIDQRVRGYLGHLAHDHGVSRLQATTTGRPATNARPSSTRAPPDEDDMVNDSYDYSQRRVVAGDSRPANHSREDPYGRPSRTTASDYANRNRRF